MLELLSALLVGAVPAPCPFERAQYALRADPSVTLTFHRAPRNGDWPGGIAAEMRFGETGNRYWWLPAGGGSAGYIEFHWVRMADSPDWMAEQALKQVTYYATDASYDFLDTVPAAGQEAPAHILFPELGQAMWYGTHVDHREHAPLAFFDRTACHEAEAGPVAMDLPPVP